VSGDALNCEETGSVGFRGVEGVPADEEFVDTFAVGIFDFKIDSKAETAFEVTALLAVGVAGVGVFKVVFHHLPEFLTGDVADREMWVVGDDVVEVVHSYITRRNGGTVAPTI